MVLRIRPARSYFRTFAFAAALAAVCWALQHVAMAPPRLGLQPALATSPTATPSPTPTPAPVATAVGALCIWEHTTAMGNCGWFPDAAGKQLFIARGVSTKAGAQIIQVYDQATAPPSGAPIATYEAAASPAGNWSINLAPEAITLRNGALVCNSTNSDPTAYTAGAADTTFEVCFR